MKNSDKFKSKLMKCRIYCILITIFIIFFLIKYAIYNLVPYINKNIVFAIIFVIVLCILIISINYLNKLNNLSKLGNKKIYDELDNNIDKVFDDFGLYITKNYIICIGSEINLFKIFIVSIDSIDAIDTFNDSRHFYKKRGVKVKHKFLSFIISLIKDKLTYGDDNEIRVFNIICDKKVYSICTSHSFNKYKIKKINEAAEYICNKYKRIDWI